MPDCRDTLSPNAEGSPRSRYSTAHHPTEGTTHNSHTSHLLARPPPPLGLSLFLFDPFFPVRERQVVSPYTDDVSQRRHAHKGSQLLTHDNIPSQPQGTKERQKERKKGKKKKKGRERHGSSFMAYLFETRLRGRGVRLSPSSSSSSYSTFTPRQGHPKNIRPSGLKRVSTPLPFGRPRCGRRMNRISSIWPHSLPGQAAIRGVPFGFSFAEVTCTTAWKPIEIHVPF